MINKKDFKKTIDNNKFININKYIKQITLNVNLIKYNLILGIIQLKKHDLIVY